MGLQMDFLSFSFLSFVSKTLNFGSKNDLWSAIDLANFYVKVTIGFNSILTATRNIVLDINLI